MSLPGPRLDPRLAALLGRVWPGLPAAVARAEALGFPWAGVSTPFVRWEGARAVAHVGLLELPLVIGGRQHRIGAIHAVCTDPERRGRGLARALLREALATGRERYETLVLTTLIPDFYQPLGFRTIREHAFSRPLSGRIGPGGRSRTLTDAPADRALLRRLLEARAPVSERLGPRERGVVFVVALLLTWGDLSRVHYHPALDAVTVHEVRDRTLLLYDVVSPAIPSLEVLLGAIDPEADRVLVFFPPDRLGGGFQAEPWDRDRALAIGADWFAALMALGPLPGETGELMLAPLSRT